MNIEAIITCVGPQALEMLKFTLPKNRKHFDRVIVITKFDDVDTQEFAKQFADVVTTDKFVNLYTDFNKGAAIREGIKKLSKNEWVCHLDADILLPDNFRQVLERECNDIECFYGARRVIVPRLNNDLLDLWFNLKKEEDFVIYSAVGHGYLQIWHQQSEIVRSGHEYPDGRGVAESDWMWRNLWGDCTNEDKVYTGKLRKLSVNVLHLGEPGIDGADKFWNS